MANKENIRHRAQGFWSEFKRFAIKGNAMELAIAVVIGTAFTGIVNSLVADIITPFIGFVTGNVDLKTLTFSLRPDLVIKCVPPGDIQLHRHLAVDLPHTQGAFLRARAALQERGERGAASAGKARGCAPARGDPRFAQSEELR
jgi:hypothetical protein